MKTILFFLFTAQIYSQDFSKAIEDNSFFIEEAYNQEEGIIQHIFTSSYNFSSKTVEPIFTQEWPMFTQKHQFSYTLPMNYFSKNETELLLNYRYQLINKNGFAVSPRLSVAIENKNYNFSGMKFNLPISKRWSNDFISHFNFELPDLKNKNDFNLGMSGIYLLNENFNLMSELLYSKIENSNEIIFNPGFRHALNFDNLQIVSGVGFPLFINSNKIEKGIFLYLSFEHGI